VPTDRASPGWRGIAYALAAAVLFGASTPAAKVLLADLSPLLLAGLLYLGSGVGLSLLALTRQLRPQLRRSATPLTRRDLPWLFAAVLTGGIAGPVLLLWGLARTPAATASLLLNLEGVLTAVVAALVFREHYGPRNAAGVLAIFAGGAFLSWGGAPQTGALWGVLAIAGACAAWALDNNLTRHIAHADPVHVAAVKGLVAGTTNVLLALTVGVPCPNMPDTALAGALGLLGYGLSLVLFILALRHLGAARTGAYFSCAPFVGAAIAIALLGERPTLPFLEAAVLMAVGLRLHLTEHHAHLHTHSYVAHNHWHEHDAHHQHTHANDEGNAEPHAHPHEHEPLRHSPPHFPDTHHRHDH